MSTAVTLSVTAVALAGMPLKVGMLLASAARSVKSTRVTRPAPSMRFTLSPPSTRVSSSRFGAMALYVEPRASKP